MKKRRRVIATLILLLSFLCSWWSWPRGDARLVGTWAATAEDGSAFGTWTFSRNGIGAIDEGPGGIIFHMSWQVEGDELVVGIPEERLIAAGFTKAVAAVIRRFSNRTLIYWYKRKKLLTVEQDVLVIDQAGPNDGKLTLRRLAE